MSKKIKILVSIPVASDSVLKEMAEARGTSKQEIMREAIQFLIDARQAAAAGWGFYITKDEKSRLVYAPGFLPLVPSDLKE